MNKSIILFSLAGLALCSGCASIVSETTYPVTISSYPEGARYSVRNEAGITVAKGTTPATIMLKASAGFFDGETYTVSYNGGAVVATLESKLDGWYFGNILFGGLIGLLIVDPATGAMWKLPQYVSTDVDFANGENSDKTFSGVKAY